MAPPAGPLAVAAVDRRTPLVGICEPSAATTAPDGTVWIADDDQDQVLFRWTPGDTPPTAVDGLRRGADPVVEDIEGLTTTADGRLWVMGSHSLSRKGKRKRRARLVLTAPTATPMPVLTDTSWWEAPSLDTPQPLVEALTAQCPDCRPTGSWATLNLEGISRTADHRVLLGARAPLLADGAALVLETTPPDRADAPPTLAAVHRLDLGGRGIRALTPSGSGHWLIAGPSVDTDPQALGFHVYTWTVGSAPTPLARLPALAGSPEALVPTGPHSAWVLVDMGDVLKAAAERDPAAPHRRVTAGGTVKFRCGAGLEGATTVRWAEAVHVQWTAPVPTAGPIR